MAARIDDPGAESAMHFDCQHRPPRGAIGGSAPQQQFAAQPHHSGQLEPCAVALGHRNRLFNLRLTICWLKAGKAPSR
jgi:hypothetical protein